MFLVNWFNGILGWLGLGNKRAKILFLGLDNAGKTTLLHMLKEKKVAQLEPTQHPHDEELTMGKLKFRVHDLGGHDVARELWQEYFSAVNAIVYIVDCNDRERFAESRAELDKLLSNEMLAGVPVVVLGNKIDMQRAASEAELRQALGIQAYLTGKNTKKSDIKGYRPMELYMVSVIKRMGYREGFQWIAQYID
mmetsp:Transcript_10953/g.22039  ORF Transcript_10953/g.22039 Transcript_10953/m.22039 type:complete len:194 (+) Transcript_10953:206-787(+)|eukprot:CAMPEP_0181308852 /NCGR_PEP_ID=MMETSP1101-20121128/11699_1 /TAXON_ID=46948 /ORGANISM="Rhodomonas abbreviata, Strain Caron Lab Isolate" /LENGTH=193 /DNA_ID=CAMNT_0023415293 /DNA_START=201 /DNA_END=782 /DNA_ORIENTATION=+